VAEELRQVAARKERFVVAVAGPPGVGKTTFACELVEQLSLDSAVHVPMDGFHYDNVVLDRRNLRDCKGAPETFDYPGFRMLMQRIRSREEEIAIPVFDREADLSRGSAQLIERGVKFIIVEGNYLLLNEEPWCELSAYFDFSVFLDAPQDELARRLTTRWTKLGLSHEATEMQITRNDLPNADRIRAASRGADLYLS
jgi:pantothenate kinase